MMLIGNKFFFILLLVSNLSYGGWYPPLKKGMNLPYLDVFNEREETKDLKSFLSVSGPVILLPLFIKCKVSCPLMIKALKKSVDEFESIDPQHQPYRVALLSFDASDSSLSLRKLRIQENLNKDWLLFGCKNQSAIRDFFDHYSYSIMTDTGGFNHPNQVLILSSELKWVGSLFGSNLNGKDISTAYRSAMQTWTIDPEAGVIWGGIGLLIGLISLFWFSRSFRRTSKA